jgi:hypothetical protein
MKNILKATLLLLICALPLAAQTKTETAAKKEDPKNKKEVEAKNQAGQGKHFVDKNGDGFNDNAPDDDGDGIPNCIDPDFKGRMLQKGKKNFIDKNGDGINDNSLKNKIGPGKGAGYGMGKKQGLAKGNIKK